MLEQTFCHIPGIGPRSERDLWAAGVHSWSALDEPASLLITPAKRDTLKRDIDESRRQLEAGNARYFGKALRADQVWRVFPQFRKSTAYLDIETTGLSGYGDHVTTIALYDGVTVRHYIHGQNLADFARDIRGYDVVVTYNGKCFDVPFIRQSMGVEVDQAHIDLRYVLKSLGYSGGLKGCEKQLGISRGDLSDVDGFFAVVLWHEFRRRNDAKALQTLLAYNIQDVLNLEELMVMAYNLKVRETPFGDRLAMEKPTVAANPFEVDLPTVHRLRGRW